MLAGERVAGGRPAGASGMFVGAQAFRASVCDGVFTHYKREEDAAMEGGKLDEELRRMSAIADQIRPAALLLCNAVARPTASNGAASTAISVTPGR